VADENKRLLAGAIGLALLLIAALTYFLVRPKGTAAPQANRGANR